MRNQLLRNAIIILTFCLSGFNTLLKAQTNNVQGIVLDQSSQKPLVFVSVYDPDRNVGTVSDIDGKFQVASTSSIRRLVFSYVGYQPDTILVDGKKNLKIELTSKGIELNQITIYPGENPAHRIIKLAVENRENNNPNKYDQYTYDSYNKMIFSMDTIPTTNNPEEDAALEKFLRENHILLMESATTRKFLAPNHSKEVVTGTRVSGFDNPAFSFLPTDLQPFGFYDTYVELFDKSYLNPVSQGSWNRYVFDLKDTLYSKGDSTFVIQYQPKRNSNFEGIKGLLYINSNGYAIENVIAENFYEGINNFKIQQKYALIENKWFPEQLNFDLTFVNLDLVFVGRSYIENVNLHPELTRKDFDNFVVEIPDSSATKDEYFWYKHRSDTLTTKDKNTYTTLDSMGKELNLERVVKWSEELVNGYFPLGPINLDVNQLIHINQFEGTRLGLGLYTNKKIADWFAIGGYGAYGFKDKEWKYGGSLEFFPLKQAEMKIKASYSYDVYNPGTSQFFEDHLAKMSDSWRNLISTWMNYGESYELSWQFRTLKYAKVKFYGEHNHFSFNNAYQFRLFNNDELSYYSNEATVAETGVQLKYAYGEKLVRTQRNVLSMGTDKPVLWINYGRGISDVEGSKFDYNKVEAKLYKHFKTRVLGEFSISLSGGYVDASLPVNSMFVGNGTFEDDIKIVVNNSFQTMRLYEFIGDKYAALHYNHRLWRWYSKYKWLRPEFFMTHNIGWGEADDALLKDHKGIEFKSMEEGFFESGLQIHHLLRMEYADVGYLGVGIGTFYRYGAYQYEKAENNLALKVVVTLEL